MAIFKEQTVPRKEPSLMTETQPRKDTDTFRIPCRVMSRRCGRGPKMERRR
jgi:hypothetical protein